MLRFPWWLRQSRICLQCRIPRFDPLGQDDPLEKEWQPIPVFLPGEFHGSGAWWAAVHGVT